MKEQTKKEIITKLNDLKMRINWWNNFMAEKMTEGNEKEANQARVVINTLSAEYWGMQYILNQFGSEIELDKNGRVEELVNF